MSYSFVCIFDLQKWYLAMKLIIIYFFFIKYSQQHVLEDLLVLLRVSCVRAFNTSPFTFASPVPLGIGR